MITVTPATSAGGVYYRSSALVLHRDTLISRSGGFNDMKRLSVPRVMVLCAILAWMVCGCSGGSGSPTAPPLQENRETAGGVLTLESPVVSGDEISVAVEYSDAHDLYAMSFRIGFDSDGLRPVGVEWGDIVGDEDSTFQFLNAGGIVPLAFARFSGLPGIDGNGTLCTVRFRILDPERTDIGIIQDPDYLVARDSMGRPLTLAAGGESR
jgi:hypothetical protein